MRARTKYIQLYMIIKMYYPVWPVLWPYTDKLVEILLKLNGPVIFAGDGVSYYAEILKAGLGKGRVCPAMSNPPGRRGGGTGPGRL